MDVSKEIFILNKEILLFKINSNQSILSSHSSLHSSDLKPLSEENITVTNITSEYIAFRAKTTKKDNYTVNPTYCVIPPNQSQVLNIILYNKSHGKLDSKGHKFKFEGFIIPESKKNEIVKNLFQDYIQQGIKVVGNSQKRYVQFLEENNEENNLLIKSSGSIISNYTVAEDKKNNKLLNEKIQENIDENIRLSDIVEGKNDLNYGMNNNKKIFEELKKEYNMLKDQFDNLKRDEEILNKRIKNEKNIKNPSQGSNKFNYKIPISKEEKISMNKLIGIFIISVFVGFYLIK